MRLNRAAINADRKTATISLSCQSPKRDRSKGAVPLFLRYQRTKQGFDPFFAFSSNMKRVKLFVETVLTPKNCDKKDRADFHRLCPAPCG